MLFVQKREIVLFSLMLFLLSLTIEKTAEAAGFVDTFWSVVYWVGDSLVKTSVGQFLERGVDGFLGLFGVHVTGYVTPDYWGALTGTYSKEIGTSVPIPGQSRPYECKVLEPRMIRSSTSAAWDYDEFVQSYLKDCYQTAKELLLKSARNFSS
jgi:hypothetical protein